MSMTKYRCILLSIAIFSFAFIVQGSSTNEFSISEPSSNLLSMLANTNLESNGLFAQSCRPNANQIAVFEHANYRGRCRIKTIGSYSSSRSIGLKNDSISSIIVGRNVIAVLCEHTSFRGKCQTFSRTDSNLSNNTVGNDAVSSIRVIRKNTNPPNSRYRFCANEGQRCNFRGRGIVAYGTNGRFKYKRNVSGGIACNNRTFGDPAPGAPKRCFYLAQGTTSQTCRPNANQIAIFYDSNYRGRCRVRGIGNYPSPRYFGLPNDSISSIIVGRNVGARLCRDDNYRGTCETYRRSDANLGNNSIGNDQVSSIRVFRRGSTTPNRGVRIRFENRSNYKVSFYWVNGNSERFYKTLNRNSTYTQSTRLNHLWRVKLNGKTIGSYRARNLSTQTVRVTVKAYNAGPIFSQRDAVQKCNNLARSRRSLWTGAWRTTVVGRQSVCELARLSY